MPPATISLKPGETGAAFFSRNKLQNGHIDKQPAGIHFYEYDWPRGQPGNIQLETGAHSFAIAQALSVMAAQDIEHPERGLDNIVVNAGLSAGSTIAHDEAREKMSAILQHLLTIGWRQAISYSQPRLTAIDGFRYSLAEDMMVAAPANYQPTQQEWMQMREGYWTFYGGDFFLDVTMKRDKTKMKENEPGAYFLSFTLRSGEAEAKSNFIGDDREKWRELWVAEIKKLKSERYRKERELKRQGYEIFMQYQEPKLHPADPVEP